ncbi:hypothetical protein DNTS_011656, partial [Danionella cerebrum]
RTDPLLQCIIDNKFKRFKHLLRDRDINGLYPSEIWNDDVTPLIASVLCNNEEICSFLLKESVDVNKFSTNQQTPLHYAAFTPGVSLSLVKKILAAKANPNGHDGQMYTPLQFAADHNREDIVKALVKAGASPTRNYGRNIELDKKLDKMFYECSLRSENYKKNLDVMFQKISDQISSSTNSTFEKLTKSLLPLTGSDYSTLIGMTTYKLFAYLNDFAPQSVASCGLKQVPETIRLKAETEMEEAMKKKLQKLDDSLRNPAEQDAVDSLRQDTATLSTNKKKKKKKKKKINQDVSSQEVGIQERVETCEEKVENSIEESNSSVQPFIQLTNPRRWLKISIRWRSKLEKLASMDEKTLCKLPNLVLFINSEFLIANGSDGTQVFLGLRHDGAEVAIKRMNKLNYEILKNEEEFLRLPQLDNSSIVRYVDFAEDGDFGYLVLQLCEYTLEEYIQDHLPEDTTERTSVLKKLVKEVLCSLQVLHDQNTNVLHRDIKPQNVLIDITGNARLADFGISRRLKQGETTLKTRIAGTRCWKAKETINEKVNTRYKRSSDIQVTGMLVYYILSRGHHPFGDDVCCEYNIFNGKYSLEHLDDGLAKDLIEWMINDNPDERPDVNETLAHPFFWSDGRKVRYLKTLGNEKEAENCRNFQAELLMKLEGKKKSYPENTLGLLRFIRNLHEHYKEDAAKIDLINLFPDLFESMYKFAKERGWNSRKSILMEISST